DIEVFYESMNIKPCFYITESSPNKLDVFLAENNYTIDTKLLILSVESEMIIKQIKEDNQWQVSIDDRLTKSWMDLFMYLEGHDEKLRKGFETIFEEITLEKGFFSLRFNDE